MPYVIGTDEAGYGPNLGPLVVGATLWHVKDVGANADQVDFFRQLKSVVCQPSSKTANKIQVGDSKKLYQSGGRIGPLETSLLAFLSATGQVTIDTDSALNWATVYSELTGVDRKNLESETAYQWKELTIPRVADSQQVQKFATALSNAFKSSQVTCQKVVADLVFPANFNDGLVSFGNKASLLSSVTLQLVRRLLSLVPDGQQVLVLCDKHGGRSHYAGVIQQEMTDVLVSILQEGRQLSRYKWRDESHDVEIRFIVKGEHQMPIALASMTAKYLRELSMDAWNRYWCEKIPNLKPTAGYPQDAKRFRKDIQEVQRAMHLEDHCIWRKK